MFVLAPLAAPTASAAGDGPSPSSALVSEVELTVDPGAEVDLKTGTVTMTGWLSCSSSIIFVDINGWLTQKVGKGTISGNLGAFMDCNAPWSLAVEPDNGLFKGGKATALLTVFACGQGCFAVDVAETVQLHPDNE